MPEQRDLPRADEYQAPGSMTCAVETRNDLSHNWFVAALKDGFQH
ncbi:MAG: hypothetical protein VYE46_07255 [Cyanobacteriota bacterium]|nr:hypothetical protein [Cyanobacteriota bacterium]